MKQPHHVSRRTALLAGAGGLAATLTGSATSDILYLPTGA